MEDKGHLSQLLPFGSPQWKNKEFAHDKGIILSKQRRYSLEKSLVPDEFVGFQMIWYLDARYQLK
jgi:hypothetical protein